MDKTNLLFLSSNFADWLTFMRLLPLTRSYRQNPKFLSSLDTFFGLKHAMRPILNYSASGNHDKILQWFCLKIFEMKNI